MSSKWLDAVTHTGVFHMQQSHYNHMKPPSYYENHDLNFMQLSRDREVGADLRHKSREMRDERAYTHSINNVNTSESEYMIGHFESSTERNSKYLMGRGRLDGGWGLMSDDDTSATYFSLSQSEDSWERDSRGFASDQAGRTPSLFLQELVHLASLCNAVAYSTLRNDIEGSTSPLDFYTPGDPWPNEDPDLDDRTLAQKVWDPFRYLLGVDKTQAARTRHNAHRPLPVLGGVSKNEIKFLQKARGPSAKVTLAWHWLSEFIIREHLAGSLGKVAPPIISRLIQFLSDGMIFYNHARKTMYIPFPFPHAQISAIFVVIIVAAVPLLMDEYSNNIYVGSALTFFTVICISGLHEVAKELENPFRNVPNEIPLCNLQALFNESLVTLYAGYHPDHYWEGNDYRKGIIIEDDEPQAPESRPEKAASFADLQKVVRNQQKEIARLSALIEGTDGRGRCDTL